MLNLTRFTAYDEDNNNAPYAAYRAETDDYTGEFTIEENKLVFGSKQPLPLL